jgi:hypothetical protein
MRRRLTGIALLAIALAALSATPTAAAERSCGSFPSQARFSPAQRVFIVRGEVSCHEARSIFIGLARGKGTHHGPGFPLSEDYVTLRGWRCHSGMEVTRCIRGPAIGHHGERRDEIGSKQLPPNP